MTTSLQRLAQLMVCKAECSNCDSKTVMPDEPPILCTRWGERFRRVDFCSQGTPEEPHETIE